MNLTRDEQAWLDSYRQALADQFPNLVEEIVIFGSKARGTAKPDSDIDVLVVIREGDRRLKDAVRRPGYMLSIGTDAVPSMMVLTKEEWSLLQKREAPFWQTVTRDGVVVG